MQTIRQLSRNFNLFIREKSHFRAAVKNQLFTEQNGKCVFCGCAMVRDTLDSKKSNFATLEHITPVSEGGEDLTNNLVLSCSKCNNDRGVMDFDLWMEIRNTPHLLEHFYRSKDYRCSLREFHAERRIKRVTIGMALLMYLCAERGVDLYRELGYYTSEMRSNAQEVPYIQVA